MVCCNCLENEGLRIEAVKLGSKQDIECPNCKSSPCVKLSKEIVEELFRKFFLHGTRGISPYHPPIYRIVEADYSSDTVELDDSLKNDYDLLSKFAKIGLKYNSPPTWKVGHTYIEDEIRRALDTEHEKVLNIVDRIISRCSVSRLRIGKKIYRVRLNPQNAASPESYDSPPDNKIQEFRFNNNEQPVFYGALDIETCIHECRASVYDEIVLATFRIQRNLRIIDLEKISDEKDKSPWESYQVFLESNMNSTNYHICQLLGKRLFELGFDGIKYRSFFSNVRGKNHENIVLFLYPLN